MRKAVLLLSGGQDSTLCGFWAKRGFDEVHAITVNYGQRHNRELDAARKIGELLGVASHEFLDVGKVLKGSSPLVSDNELEQYERFEDMPTSGVEPTFVPLRNMLFLTLCANHARYVGANDLITGVCQADYGGYPDCRQGFIDSITDTINLALGTTPENQFSIHTPLMNLTKAESINLAMTIPGAYGAWAWSHTAYDGSYPPIGRDHATVLREKGFSEANVPDPLIVRAWLNFDMDLPSLSNYEVVVGNKDRIHNIDDLCRVVGAA